MVATAVKSLVVGVDVVGADDLAAELLELGLEGRGEAGAVGLLVVDDEDLLLLGVVVQVLGGERALDGVRGGGAEVRLERAGLLAGAASPCPGSARGRCWRGRPRPAWRRRRPSAWTGRRWSSAGRRRRGRPCRRRAWWRSAGRRRAAPGRRGPRLEGDAVDVLLLVGRLGGEVGGVLDAEAERGQVAGQRGVDTDDDGGLLPLPPPPLSSSREPQAVSVSAPAVSAAVMDEQGTVTHDQSFPWRGLPDEGPSRAPGVLRMIGQDRHVTPGGAVTGRDSKAVGSRGAEGQTKV